MRVLVAVPALNEEKTIQAVVSGIPRTIPGAERIDVVVIDDGSTDSTADLALQAGARVIRHAGNRGLGAAFRSALSIARENGYDILVTIDGDGQFDPAGIGLMLQSVLDGTADLVTCSRFISGTAPEGIPWIKRFGNRRVAGLVNRLAGADLHDATCGFRAYGPSALERLTSFSRFTYTQETMIDLAWKGMSIKEIALPVIARREYGRSRISGNLLRYAILSAGAMYSAAHDHMPWKFYGIPGLVMILGGLVAEAAVFTRWLMVALVTPFKGVAIAGLFLVVIGLLFAIMASLADSSSHNRHLLEELTTGSVRSRRKNRKG